MILMEGPFVEYVLVLKCPQVEEEVAVVVTGEVVVVMTTEGVDMAVTDLALQGDRREETREAGAEVVAGEEACPTKGL